MDPAVQALSTGPFPIEGLSGYFPYYYALNKSLYRMQTVQTWIMLRLTWVYTICQRSFMRHWA